MDACCNVLCSLQMGTSFKPVGLVLQEHHHNLSAHLHQDVAGIVWVLQPANIACHVATAHLCIQFWGRVVCDVAVQKGTRAVVYNAVREVWYSTPAAQPQVDVGAVHAAEDGGKQQHGLSRQLMSIS